MLEADRSSLFQGVARRNRSTMTLGDSVTTEQQQPQQHTSTREAVVISNRRPLELPGSISHVSAPESNATAMPAEEAIPSLNATEILFEPAELDANPHRRSAHGVDLEGVPRTSTTGRSSLVALRVWSVTIAFLLVGVISLFATAAAASWAGQTCSHASGFEPHGVADCSNMAPPLVASSGSFDGDNISLWPAYRDRQHVAATKVDELIAHVARLELRISELEKGKQAGFSIDCSASSSPGSRRQPAIESSPGLVYARQCLLSLLRIVRTLDFDSCGSDLSHSPSGLAQDRVDSEAVRNLDPKADTREQCQQFDIYTARGQCQQFDIYTEPGDGGDEVTYVKEADMVAMASKLDHIERSIKALTAMMLQFPFSEASTARSHGKPTELNDAAAGRAAGMLTFACTDASISKPMEGAEKKAVEKQGAADKTAATEENAAQQRGANESSSSSSSSSSKSEHVSSSVQRSKS